MPRATNVGTASVVGLIAVVGCEGHVSARHGALILVCHEADGNATVQCQANGKLRTDDGQNPSRRRLVGEWRSLQEFQRTCCHVPSNNDQCVDKSKRYRQPSVGVWLPVQTRRCCPLLISPLKPTIVLAGVGQASVPQQEVTVPEARGDLRSAAVQQRRATSKRP
jgi:hypothetical protein